MTHNVSESIIDSLTDVKMPHYAPLAQVSGSIDLNGTILPEYRCNTLVLGSGAAGWRAAVELKRQNVDVMVASSKAFWGTSACSGSDKQTLHTANTRANGDHFLALSDTLAAGGAMDHDTAYVEAVGSVNTCEVLKYLGLDLPEDLFGATLRYQTDHDEFGRATSCGPRTSSLMVKVLAQEAMRLNIPLCDHTTAIRILTSGEGENRRVEGVIAIDKACRDNPWRMVVIRCQHLVLATGGPGELYRDSVYPVNCFSALGMALEAGITLVNLTESQFGIGTPRSQFPWNLSGTYMQAMPRIYSQDHSGR
ncbi:TPA: FAD-binding protein, partial [Escherichia coli]|nr:FAD-binding protein [Escherichia coli]